MVVPFNWYKPGHKLLKTLLTFLDFSSLALAFPSRLFYFLLSAQFRFPLDAWTEQLQNDKEYLIEGYDKHNVENLNWDFNTTFVYHSKGADDRKIYVVRDSFSNAMAPYIGSQFEDSYFRHKETYSNMELVEQNPDIVVLEVGERAIDSLWYFSFEY